MIPFSFPKLLCVGDFMIDRFIDGDVERISPEGPIPVLREKNRFYTLGGAGNVVRNLSSLYEHHNNGSSSSIFAATVLDDTRAGEQVTLNLKTLPGVRALLTVSPEWTTPLKTRFCSQGQQLLRFDQEKPCVLSHDLEEKLTHHILSILSDVDGVILSDYNKGLLTPSLCQKIIVHAKHLGKKIIVDPKGKDYTKYKGASLLTPNFSELQATTSTPLKSHDTIATAALALKNSLEIDNILVTLGRDGMLLIQDEHTVLHVPSIAREVFDVSGAGDTVIATLAFALCGGHSIKDAALLANKAGGIVVGKVGTAVIHAEELFDDTPKDMTEKKGSDKIYKLPQLLEKRKQWQRQNLRVGFTNGCFDLLHLGHLSLLQQARKKCDRLILGLNTDASIKRLKGDNRPIQSQHVRAEILAALSMVDGVILFDEDTPYHLIETLLPDVLVKGADYQVHEVVGSDIVLRHGGEIFLASLKDGYSTTNTVQSMQNKHGNHAA